MNRKNTLILAILVNAGIFLVLFVAMSRGHQDDQLQMPSSGVGDETAFLPKGKDGPLTRRADADPIKVLQDAREGSKDQEPYLEIYARRGDQLDRLAIAYGTTVEEITKVNQLTSQSLTPGQMIKIPLSRRASESANDLIDESADEMVEIDSNEPEEIYYVVKKGDTPWIIAQKHKIKLEELLRINDLDERKARRLHPGDRLKVS